MSFQAVNWSLAQECGSPSAKVTLLALAHYANEDNEAWPSQKTLAKETEQSVDTVARRLRELEAAGFIERAGERRRDDGGNTSVKWRFLFSRERHDQDLRANRERRRSPTPQIAGGGIPQDAGGHTAPVAGGAPANCGTNNVKDLPEEAAPQPPEGERRDGSSIDLEGIPSKTASARFDRFREAWPEDPTINWERVESAFYRMPADDQDHASKIASRYVEFCRREGRKLKAPQNWLRDRGWTGFLEVERKASAAVEQGRTMVWVIEGTRAWDAWRAWSEAKGKVPKVAMQVRAQKGLGNFFPSLFPPAGGISSVKQG